MSGFCRMKTIKQFNSIFLISFLCLAGAMIVCAESTTVAKATTADADSPKLWRNVRYGMTLTQVTQVAPSGHRPAHEDPAIDANLSELLVADDRLNGRAAQVKFYFKKGRLVVVSLSVEGDDLDERYVKQVIDDLNLKFGEPRNAKHYSPHTDGGVWISKNITVTMLSILADRPGMGFRLPTSRNTVTLNYFSSAYYWNRYGHWLANSGHHGFDGGVQQR